MKGCRDLTPSEVRRTNLSHYGRWFKRNRALFQSAIYTGYRISELLSIRVGDVYQNGKIVDEMPVERKHMKKKTEGRRVTLHNDARIAIKEWINDLKKHGELEPEYFLFHPQGAPHKPLSRGHAWSILKTAYKHAGVTGKVAWHSTRKTFGTHMYDLFGRDLFRLQQALGHRDPKSTTSYLSIGDDEVSNAIHRLKFI